MPLTPFTILGIWLRGLLAVAVLAGGVTLLGRWYRDAHEPVPEPSPPAVRVTETDPPPTAERDWYERGEAPAPAPVVTRRVFRFPPAWDWRTAELAGGLLLLVWGVGGRLIAGGLTALTLGAGARSAATAAPDTARTDEDPRSIRDGEVIRVDRPDGSSLRVEAYGPADAPVLLLTHGWGATSAAWYYVKTRLADRFRIVVWDLPGLGLSKKPDNNDYSLDNLAADLDAVLRATTGGRPAVLVGHSIGGMITLTFCRKFPDALGGRVAGLVLAHTTYTNPVRTTRGAAFYTALERPVLVPLLHLTVWLWPLVWALNWLSYLNGSIHRSTHRQSFAGTETPGQLDFVARMLPQARPDVLARGMFGMLHYDATDVLPGIAVPVAVVAGDQDSTTTPEASEYMARTIPRADPSTLSPAAHMGVIERHEQFGATLAEFASACLSAGAARP